MRGALALLRPKDNVLTNLPFPGLKIRLETSSTFSVTDQPRGWYLHKRSLWTIPTQTLYIPQPTGVDTFRDIFYYESSLSITQTTGSSLSYSFDGTAIWYDHLSRVIHWPACSIGTMVALAQCKVRSSLNPLPYCYVRVQSNPYVLREIGVY